MELLQTVLEKLDDEKLEKSLKIGTLSFSHQLLQSLCSLFFFFFLGNHVSKVASSILQRRSATSLPLKEKIAPPPLSVLESTSLFNLLPPPTNGYRSSTSGNTGVIEKNVFLLSGEEMLAVYQNIKVRERRGRRQDRTFLKFLFFFALKKLPTRDARMSKQTFAQFAYRTGMVRGRRKKEFPGIISP